MSAPRILLVDDQRSDSRSYRSRLELSGRAYTVIDVPSGEEALLELNRSSIDLVITGLRLPGISGLELLEKVRQLSPKARALVITAHPSKEARARAEELGVVAFLEKPLETSPFLEAVERALELSVEAGAPVQVLEEEKPRMAERLIQLRRELGADATYLLDDQGRIVVRAGDLTDLDLEAAVHSLMSAFSAGLKVSSLLGSLLPANFQYFDGDSHDIYLTNIGAFYALLIAYRGRQAAGQMGSVVHYGSRAANDLLAALSSMGVVEQEVLEESNEPGEENSAVVVDEQTQIAFEVDAADLEAAAEQLEHEEVDSYWEDAAQSTPRGGEGDALTFEQARKLGLLGDEFDS